MDALVNHFDQLIAPFVASFFAQEDWTNYLMIPFFSGIVGLVTNFIGIKMMFYPLHFKGLRPFLGWQGIIPARAGKFANLQMQQVEKLIDINQLMKRVNSAEVISILRPNLRNMIEDLVEDIGTENFPVGWENTPLFIRKRIVSRIERETPSIINDIHQELSTNINTLFDPKIMVVAKLSHEKHILVDLIHEIIDKELSFLVQSGLYLGFLFGIVQMILWYLFPNQWLVLPIGGFAVGYLTNYIAVKLMFRPLDPIKIGPFKLHGLFLKRKKEVAKDYSRVFSTKVINAQSIAHYLLNDDANRRIHKMLNKHIRKVFDQSLGMSKPLVAMSVGTDRFITIRESLSQRISSDLSDAPKPINDCIAYSENAIGLKDEMEKRMLAFSSQDLDDFVRPIFEEDEWILYAVGGCLGFFAGWCQLVLMFS